MVYRSNSVLWFDHLLLIIGSSSFYLFSRPVSVSWTCLKTFAHSSKQAIFFFAVTSPKFHCGNVNYCYFLGLENSLNCPCWRDQHLGAAHSKRWSKSAFSMFFEQKNKKYKKGKIKQDIGWKFNKNCFWTQHPNTGQVIFCIFHTFLFIVHLFYVLYFVIERWISLWYLTWIFTCFTMAMYKKGSWGSVRIINRKNVAPCPIVPLNGVMTRRKQILFTLPFTVLPC